MSEWSVCAAWAESILCVRVIEILRGVQAEGGQQPDHSGASLLARHPERRRAHVGGVRRADGLHELEIVTAGETALFV